MADQDTLYVSDGDTFHEICPKLLKTCYKDDDSSKTNLNLLLDELNSLNYSSKFVSIDVSI